MLSRSLSSHGIFLCDINFQKVILKMLTRIKVNDVHKYDWDFVNVYI